MKRIAPIFLFALLTTGCAVSSQETATVAPNGEAKKEYLEIANYTRPCDAGAMRMQCMQVRHITDFADGKPNYKNTNWENFYFSIENFTHNTKKNQFVEVLVYPVKNPPADAPNLRYKLVKVLNVRQ